MYFEYRVKKVHRRLSEAEKQTRTRTCQEIDTAFRAYVYWHGEHVRGTDYLQVEDKTSHVLRACVGGQRKMLR